MFNPRRTNPNSNPLRSLMLVGSCIAVCGFMAGCSGNAPANFGVSTTSPAGKIKITGQVYGGQQPIVDAVVQLYTVGTSGVGSASTPLIGATLTSSDGTGTMDSNANAGNANNTLPAGSFTITGDYSCTGSTPGTLVYLAAIGGQPTTNTTNSNVTMMAALGDCNTLVANANTTFINMNEITTVAAAYAFAPFATDYAHIGATGSEPTGLLNAFNNAAILANTTSGQAGGASLAPGVTVPTLEINTLANIIAHCVNTAGASSGPCTDLFAATGATDTFGGALGIAKNPSATAVTALYQYSDNMPGSPFQPASYTRPSDYTVAVTMSANGGLSTPYGVAIDGSGNAWVTNESGTTVTALSPAGAVIATPTATGLAGPQGIAIDKTTANVWVANTAGNSVIRFGVSGSTISSTNVYTGSGISAPAAVAVDSAGNAFIANFNGNSVTELSNTGANQNGSPFFGTGTSSANSNVVTPSGIAIGPAGSAYVTSANGYVVKLSNTGAYTTTLTDSALQGPASLAVAGSSVVATGFTTGASVGGALGEYSTAGAAAANSPVSAQTTPAGVATDYTSFFVANSVTSGGLTKYAYNSATPVSPTGGYGSLNTPIGVAVDASGSVWTTNSGSNNLSVFIGLAAATATPIAINVGP